MKKTAHARTYFWYLINLYWRQPERKTGLVAIPVALGLATPLAVYHYFPQPTLWVVLGIISLIVGAILISEHDWTHMLMPGMMEWFIGGVVITTLLLSVLVVGHAINIMGQMG